MKRIGFNMLLTGMLIIICQSICGQYLYDRSNMTIGWAKDVPAAMLLCSSLVPK